MIKNWPVKNLYVRIYDQDIQRRLQFFQITTDFPYIWPKTWQVTAIIESKYICVFIASSLKEDSWAFHKTKQKKKTPWVASEILKEINHLWTKQSQWTQQTPGGTDLTSNINSSDVAEVEELLEPAFTEHAHNASISVGKVVDIKFELFKKSYFKILRI